MDPGGADIAITPGGGMDGWLTHDNNDLPAYGFVPGAREQFDTRLVSDCDGSAGTCRVWQSLGPGGDPDPNETLNNGRGGYLVSAYYRLTLRRLDAAFFTTAGNPSGSTAQVQEMAQFLNTYRAPHGENLVMVTSVHTPGQPQPQDLVDASVPVAAWSALTDEIAALGGTKHRFNTAASTPGTDYTLIGHGSYLGGAGSESIGPNARIRGALAPDLQSMFAPTNVSTAGAAPEKLLDLIIREPDPTWPLDDDRGASNALTWIGHFLGLGYDVRAAYWTTSMGATQALGLVSTLQCDTTKFECAATPRMPKDPPAAPNDFNATDFNHAMSQLIDELGYVARVREYLTHLAYPLGDETAVDPWEAAATLENNLTQQLKNLTDQANVAFDGLAFLKSLADVAGLLLGVPDAGTLAATAAKAFKAVATGSEFAKVFVDAKYGGSPGAPIDSGNIQANKLGERLQAEANATATSFTRMGDIIVSDWSKLQELGMNGHAGCNPVPGGCEPGYEEFAWTDGVGGLIADATSKALEQTIHQHLVPGAFGFPVWNTGLSNPCDQPCSPPVPADQADCGYYKPVLGRPEACLVPGAGGARSIGCEPALANVSLCGPQWSQIRLGFGRFPRADVDPDHRDPDTGKRDALNMAPEDFFPAARPPYDGGGECSW